MRSGPLGPVFTKYFTAFGVGSKVVVQMTKKNFHYAEYFLLCVGLITFLTVAGCKNSLVGLGGRVDVTPPEGDITSITNGDYVRGVITLEGTIEDDKEANAVWAVINDEIVSGVINSDGSWEIEVDTEDEAYGGDGDKDIVVYLRDGDGKITEKQLLLYFDNTEPVLMVTSPELSSPQDTTSFAVKGEAYDPLRLDSVTATISGPSGPTITENLGTSDSWYFTVSHSSSGTYNITITAKDKAGNTSSHIFHSVDLKYVNGGSSITVIDLYNLYSHEDGDDDSLISDLTITPEDLMSTDLGYELPSGSRRLSLLYDGVNSGLAVDVDMTLDIPEITVNNPNPNAASPGDTLGPTSKINGTVSDNVSVNPDSIEIRFLDSAGNELTGADAALSTWTAVTSYQYINDKNYNFSQTLPVFSADDEYSFEIRAEDENSPTPNEYTTDVIPFVLDSNAPVVEITSPALGSYISSSSEVIEGIVNDTEDITVRISLNDDEYVTVGTYTGDGNDQSWSYIISDYEALYGAIGDYETVNVTVAATAGSSTTRTNNSFIMDRLSPEVEFLTPDDGSDVNGVVKLRVSVSDNSLDTVSYEIGNPGNGLVYGVDEDDIYSFSHSIVTTEFEYSPIATENPSGSGIWELPITVTAEDKAGNITVTSGYSLFIDNARDRPEVSIIYPAEGESYGGEVTVSGIATDDDGTVAAVYAQVDLDTLTGEDPDFAGYHTLTDGIVFDGTNTVYNIDETVGYQVHGLSSWSFSLNSTGELYDMGGGHNGDIYVKVWAEDPENSAVLSEEQVLHFRLDDTLPHIENVLIDGVGASANDYISGTVLLTADVSDNSKINKVEMSYNNGVNWETLAITPAASITPVVSINTETRVSGGNGILYLRMKATDDTGFNTQEVLPLNVDNNAPTGTYLTSGDVVLSGTDATLQGTAADLVGSIAGIDRIEVYLERLGLLYDPQSAYSYTNPATPDIATEETTFGSGLYYPADDDGDDSTPLPGLIIIDDIYEGGDDSASGDGDGYDESMTLSESTWSWWVNFNSENIPDGDITIHYVVVDEAGNMTHYTQAARIENNPPVIESVVLGTDVNYTTTVDTAVGNGESFRFIDGTGTDGSGIYYRDFDSSVTGITVRNSRLYIDADETSGTGNGDVADWSWELLYKGSGSNLFGAGADSATITDFTSMLDEDEVSYILRVTDDAGLSDEAEFLLDLDNSDTTNPVVSLNPLNLNYQASIAARIADESDAYGYAIPGYDPGEDSPWEGADGRLQPVGNDSYDGDDADVSGTVIISGTVYDNNAIDSLALTITGYDGGEGAGTEFIILDWDASANSGLGGLKVASGVTGTPYISSRSYGESAGHSVAWSFRFDTSAISGVAASNVSVTARGIDKSSNSGTDSYGMDVMPYISDIRFLRGSVEYSVSRSRFGSWPIPEGSDIVIDGFNLNPSWIRLVKTGGSSGTAADYDELYSSDITVDSSDYQSVSASLTSNGSTPLYHSGFMELEVNSQPLMNHNNDDLLAINEEDDGISGNGYSWPDDRYIELWDVDNAVAGSSGSVYGAADVMPDDGDIAASWINYGNAQTYVSDGLKNGTTDGSRDEIFYSCDPPEFTDIGLNADGEPYTVYLANFFNGSTTYGSLALWGRNAPTSSVGYYYNRYSNPVAEIDPLESDQLVWQFLNPRIAVRGSGNDTDIYISYYDDYSKALKFAHYFDDGNDLYNYTFSASDTGNNDRSDYVGEYNEAPVDVNIIAGTVSASDSDDQGYWSDIAVDKNGYPVIVYYDTGTSTLKLMRAVSADPIPDDTGSDGIPDAYTNDWTSQTIDTTGSYIGSYCAIAIDPTSGDVHIAAYQTSSGNLVYYYAPGTDSGNYTFTKTVIDDEGNRGVWLDISLLDGEPVISYLDYSRIGTLNGLMVARLNSDSEWEYSRVPASNPVGNSRLSVEGLPSTATGLSDADDYEIMAAFESTYYQYVRLRPEK